MTTPKQFIRHPGTPRRTHCKNGHEKAGDNLHVVKRDEIRSLRRAGLSLRQIAKRTSRAYMTVWVVLQEVNQ